MSKALIETFYAAFATRDAGPMTAAYHQDAHFSDPVFTDLRGPKQIGGMWSMLCERGKDLRIELKSASADGDTGQARWEAFYSFSATGRPVHNIIDATFKFKDGRIIDHHDRFDFYRWTRMALPFVQGTLLGWTPLVQNAIRKKAQKGLETYLAGK